jgi:hypothetical protein
MPVVHRRSTVEHSSRRNKTDTRLSASKPWPHFTSSLATTRERERERWQRTPMTLSMRLLTLEWPCRHWAVSQWCCLGGSGAQRWRPDEQRTTASPEPLLRSVRATVVDPRRCYLRRVLMRVQGRIAPTSGSFLRWVQGKPDVGKWRRSLEVPFQSPPMTDLVWQPR